MFIGRTSGSGGFGSYASVLGGKALSIEEKYDEVRQLISIGKEKGYLLYDEVNELLPADITSSDELDKTNDPVRMYLREMGTVPLLTREGEVEIAKRIERGKLAVIKSISRTP